MRVTMVTPYLLGKDGLANYSSALIGELTSLGHEVSVLLPVRGRGLLSGYAYLPNVPTARATRDLIAQLDRPDMLHVQFAVSAFHTRLPALIRLIAAAEANDLPVVATLHEVARDLDLLGPAGRSLYRSLTRRCARLLVHTDSALDRLVTEVGVERSKIVVTPHFQQPAPSSIANPAALRDRYGIAPNDAVVLAFGFIHVDKGLDTLIESWLLLRDRRPDLVKAARLVVAGAVRRRSGPFRLFEARDHLHLRRVLALVRRASADRDVVFTGHVPETEVSGWFATANIGVLPYHRIEQSGVGSLARAYGLPVVVSDVGELTKLTTPELICAARDVSSLADVLQRCLEKLPSRTEPARLDSEVAVDATARKVTAIYESVVDDRTQVVVNQSVRLSHPLVSCVVCSFNGERGLGRCLNALSQQQVRSGQFELIVVDDGSTDRTSEIARQYGATILRHTSNRGLAAARNTALSHASAPVVAFIDDDCEVAPDWAAALLEAWNAVGDDVLIIGGALDPVVADTPAGRFTRRHDPLKPLELDLAASTSPAYRLKLYFRRLRSPTAQTDVRRVFTVAGANLSIRRDAALAAGGFDERFRFGSEDLEICLRLAEGRPISPIVFDPKVRVRHHFVGSTRDTVRRARAYGRGSARLSRARDDVPPTIFPIPFLTAVLLSCGFWLKPAALAAVVAPPLIYGTKASDPDATTPTATTWLDPYFILLQEAAANQGFVTGWFGHRYLAASARAAHLFDASTKTLRAQVHNADIR